jgi:hypothetical protein
MLECFTKFVDIFVFQLKLDNNNGHYARGPMCLSAHKPSASR